MTQTDKLKPKERPHYVNNRQFSEAVFDYVTLCNQAEEQGEPLPVVPTYIADCFLKICEGLSHKPNFIGYTYREEMVMDAVENCLRAIRNYNIKNATRTGKPNSFGYFTQIAYRAFIRRIDKENKQLKLKNKLIRSGVADMVVHQDRDLSNTEDDVNAYVEGLRAFNDNLAVDVAMSRAIEPTQDQPTKKQTRKADSDLSHLL